LLKNISLVSTLEVRPRDTYRHGHLRRALLEAGLELARHGGPDAVVLREATRRAGVAPNAAYRHFANRQDLLQAVRVTALAALAKAMEAELANIPKTFTKKESAKASVRAVGTGYLRFAKSEPGLFRTAFAASDKLLQSTPKWSSAGPGGLNPLELLGAALDKLVDAGLMPPVRRTGAEFIAWSAVHGLAMLVIDGPLAVIKPKMEQVGQRLLDMVEKGLT
jgi:AcrR family transcriptional regulator